MLDSDMTKIAGRNSHWYLPEAEGIIKAIVFIEAHEEGKYGFTG